MGHRWTSRLIVAASLAGATTASAQALKQAGLVRLPDAPVTQIGAIAVDPAAGLGYLAEKDNRGVVVFDLAKDAFVSRVAGFAGITKDPDASGPNSVLPVNAAEVWVGDGDSTVRIVDPRAGKVTATIATGGKLRANAMARDPAGKTVIVANSNDEVPFLSVVSSEPGHGIVSKIPVPQSAENIERSVFQASAGLFWTAIPVFAGDRSKGLLAQTESRTGKLVRFHELDGCHPHSLQLVSETTIFLGCSNGHGPAPKPGGDLAVFDIAAGKVVARFEGLGGNGSSALDPAAGRYYHATTNASLLVIDIATRTLVEKIATSPGARAVAVNPANGRVWLATTAKEGPCGGCIVVYAGR